MRNHLPVPDIKVTDYELEIEIENGKRPPVVLSFDDIKALPKTSITAAIMCGGNRRSEMNKVLFVIY